MPEYPEHDRLEKVQKQSQACGEFLTWLQEEKHICLCRTNTEDDGQDYVPNYDSVKNLLHEFFQIDENKLEQERRKMLAHMRGDGSYKADGVGDDLSG